MAWEDDEEYDAPHLEVPLGNGLIAWVSPEDADIARMGWNAKRSGNKDYKQYYAIHRFSIGKYNGEYYLHNLVWEKANEGILDADHLVDHINRDKLDNRRGNLRLATRQQNEANKRKRRTQKNQDGGTASSRYKGVNYMKSGKRKKRWRAIITVDRKQQPLGCHATEWEAAQAYNKAAKEIFGEFAFLNEYIKGTD